jgi:hypothetical protein
MQQLTTTQEATTAMAFDPHHDAKQAFTSLYLFSDVATGDHVQVQPVSRCHLSRPAPPSKPPKPEKLKLKPPMPRTNGCPVDVDGFPVDDPHAHPVSPAFQPETQTRSAGTTRSTGTVRIALTIPVIMGGHV